MDSLAGTPEEAYLTDGRIRVKETPSQMSIGLRMAAEEIDRQSL